MADLEQALAKLDEAEAHPTPDHATGYANLTRAEAIAVRAEVERLQRQLEEANGLLSAAGRQYAEDTARVGMAEATVAQLRQALEAARRERDEVYAVNAANNYDAFVRADDALGAIRALCEPDRIPLPLLNSKIVRVIDAALAGSVPATGTPPGKLLRADGKCEDCTGDCGENGVYCCDGVWADLKAAGSTAEGPE